MVRSFVVLLSDCGAISQIVARDETEKPDRLIVVPYTLYFGTN